MYCTSFKIFNVILGLSWKWRGSSVAAVQTHYLPSTGKRGAAQVTRLRWCHNDVIFGHLNVTWRFYDPAVLPGREATGFDFLSFRGLRTALSWMSRSLLFNASVPIQIFLRTRPPTCLPRSCSHHEVVPPPPPIQTWIPHHVEGNRVSSIILHK